ncbi:S-layer homology domain-containing protein [Paenibacillus sp. ISL-20]|uniref:S-layer homology domain-containing protein n=1 Tax=Paenibacillus sp. ISL-20 TaxID=2819163 RepID=UPI001BEA71C0|nr:S-layer homology domain-containing protein [Paenibacillus sp. ISL-20]MBT2760483.1 S-layer homology domain-containing protein [Paenibacillus sp. ISL-20]
MFLKRWRRLLSLTLILSLCMTTMASAAESSQSKYAWATESVDFLRSHGVFKNMENRTNTLGKMVTKSDLTLMVHRLFTDLRVESDKNINIPGVPKGHPSYQIFKDVYGSIPSAPNGLIAAADKINYGDETFKYMPEKVLTRWDLLITLNALFDDIGYSLELSDGEDIARLRAIKDLPKRHFNSYYHYDKWKYAYQPLAPEIGLMQDKRWGLSLASDLDHVKAYALLGFDEAGIMKPDTKGYFRPNQKVTLAETAVVLHRIYDYYSGSDYVREPSPDDLIPNGTRNFIYAGSPSGHGQSPVSDFALVNRDALPEFYLALKATEKIDLQINVNGEPSYYTYEQLSNPKQPVRISLNGAYYAEFIPIIRSKGQKATGDNNNIEVMYYYSDKFQDFTQAIWYEPKF